jgi:hypothetical protein
MIRNPFGDISVGDDSVVRAAVATLTWRQRNQPSDPRLPHAVKTHAWTRNDRPCWFRLPGCTKDAEELHTSWVPLNRASVLGYIACALRGMGHQGNARDVKVPPTISRL